MAKTGAVLTAGLAIGAIAALPGTARASVCTGLSNSAGSCSTVGTVTLIGGALTMVAPTTLAWSGTLNGASQTIYDTLSTDEAVDVLDLRGLVSTDPTSGWNVTATATTFTGTGTGAAIPDNASGEVLAFGGGGNSATATNTPSSVCVTIGTCTVATTTVSGFPLFVPTGGSATPTKIYNASAGTGTGIVQVGTSALAAGTNPAVWSVTLPPTLPADAYVSTVTMTVAAGP
jgi:hypothetical protein